MHPEQEARLTPLTDDLTALVERVGNRPATLQEVLEALEERGTAMLIVLLAAPFVLPIPLPGLSIVFGFAIACLGPRLALERGPWLPRFIGKRTIQPNVLGAIVRAVGKVARPIERQLRPRWEHLFGHSMVVAVSVGIVLAAILLLPPFPMPGINMLPSLAIVLFALGLMERDGLVVACGLVSLIAGYLYLYLWWDVAVRAIRQLVAFGG